MSGFVIWMTGLSGTGKSTLASLLTDALITRGIHVECLDGDEVRKNLSHGLGFTREDRDRNIRRIGYVARMVARSGACSIVAAISPYRDIRKEIRSKTEKFIEVYCECPINVLTVRDPKGLYKRALAGEIKNFTGIDDPYEIPENPEIHLRTDLTSPEECVSHIIKNLEKQGLLGISSHRQTCLPKTFGGELFSARPFSDDEFKQDLLHVKVNKDQAKVIEFVASGFLSPVSGFMTTREIHKINESNFLECGIPWFNYQFVLELPVSIELIVGQNFFVVADSKIIAKAACDEIRNEKYCQCVAGSLISYSKSQISAHEIRQYMQNHGLGSTGCVFAISKPTRKSIEQFRFAINFASTLVVGVIDKYRKAWEEALHGTKTLIFEIPTDIPIKNEQAQAIIAKNVGTDKYSLLD